MHYCGGKLISTSINQETKSCCDRMGSCCENRIVHFEVQDDYISPIQFKHIKTVELDILFPVFVDFNYEIFSEVSNAFIAFHDSSPPYMIQTKLAFLQTYLC